MEQKRSRPRCYWRLLCACRHLARHGKTSAGFASCLLVAGEGCYHAGDKFTWMSYMLCVPACKKYRWRGAASDVRSLADPEIRRPGKRIYSDASYSNRERRARTTRFLPLSTTPAFVIITLLLTPRELRLPFLRYRPDLSPHKYPNTAHTTSPTVHPPTFEPQ